MALSVDTEAVGSHSISTKPWAKASGDVTALADTSGDTEGEAEAEAEAEAVDVSIRTPLVASTPPARRSPHHRSPATVDAALMSGFYAHRACSGWHVSTHRASQSIMYLHECYGEYGIKQKPWFCLLPSFWCGRSRGRVSAVHFHSNGEAAHNKDIEPVPRELQDKEAIRIVGLQKSFRHCRRAEIKAIDGIDLSIYEGQITAVLGHNGAGKSTLFNILTGLTTPTAGTAYVYGLDVRDPIEMHEIRQMIGVCPQQDVLFDLLTAKEYLKFFAAIKAPTRVFLRIFEHSNVQKRRSRVATPQKVKRWFKGVKRVATSSDDAECSKAVRAENTAITDPDHDATTSSSTVSKTKKRKYDESYISFGFVDSNGSPLCMLCSKMLPNSSMAPAKLRRHLETVHFESKGKNEEFFVRKKEQLLESQKNMTQTINDKAMEASYLVSYRIAQAGEAHTIAENLIKPCVLDITKYMLDEKSAKHLFTVPLSNDTVSRRIYDLASYVK
ncbi:ATP-binding cassette sub-family A member 5 [Eumeta japonica]|uniref:ATP-binding cassette sub-family A member 5 n=1 Tax=Eumeta variegata TaxID=151549 RepID=A0A4C1XLA3_EUMVA|nr:ATP-binding cassette sub-family A member 5 [Eumeta japonica]